MLELLVNAFEPQAFLSNLIGEVANDGSAKAAFFALKSLGVAIFGMTSSFNQTRTAKGQPARKKRPRKTKSSSRSPVRRRK
jgi:hypothetical protein